MIQDVIDDKVTRAKAILRTAQENPAWWCEQALGVTPTEFERFCLDSWKSAKFLSFRQTIPLGERQRAAALMLMAFLHLWQDALVITLAPNKRLLGTGLWPEVESLYRGQRINLGSIMGPYEVRCGPTWFARGFGGDDPALLQGFAPSGEHVLVIVEDAVNVDARSLELMRTLTASSPHGYFVEVS